MLNCSFYLFIFVVLFLNVFPINDTLNLGFILPSGSSLIDTSQLNMSDFYLIKNSALFTEELTKNLTRNAPLYLAVKINWVDLWPRTIHHPKFCRICSVVLVYSCLQTNQPKDTI